MAEVYGIREWEMHLLTVEGLNALNQDAHRKNSDSSRRG